VVLENAVESIAKLPGIGRKTALRLALHLLKQPKGYTAQLVHDLEQLQEKVHLCKECYNLSDQEVCAICSDVNRDNSILCVVEDIRDVMAIESTASFKGRYHVLGGLINPMEGVGPHDLKINQLLQRVAQGHVRELVLALSATPEGDTTAFFMYRQLKGVDIAISVLARGVAVGDLLEYADQVTLGRSIAQRIPFEQSFSGR
jgi:recombination protein RecR